MKDKYCMRCGLLEKEVRKEPCGCYVYGKSYGRHKYMTDDDLNDLKQELTNNIKEANEH